MLQKRPAGFLFYLKFQINKFRRYSLQGENCKYRGLAGSHLLLCYSKRPQNSLKYPHNSPCSLIVSRLWKMLIQAQMSISWETWEREGPSFWQLFEKRGDLPAESRAPTPHGCCRREERAPGLRPQPRQQSFYRSVTYSKTTGLVTLILKHFKTMSKSCLFLKVH